jgi:tetratricopeptide (TPR) repeat protein
MTDERSTHAAMSRLLARYEFSALSGDERRAFEAHVLECDLCFAELERGSVATAALRERARQFRETLAADEARGARVAPGLAARLAGLARAIAAPRVFAPAAAVALLLVIVTLRLTGAPRYAHLATFPTDEVAADIVRGPGTSDAVRELLVAGAGYFDIQQYDEAARRFRAARERDPQLAEAAYLLGLAEVFQGEERDALPDLEDAARLASDDLRPKAEWVLANAYLKAGRTRDARGVLERLSRGEGEYAAKARDLLARLPS